ncbi:NmrA family NAD(P)-binding protein [Clostridium sp. MSJ-11]|uniref:NmrA family NAD(P)-binding protein n=1 Tax=Clostridium mobile TaxID=2841512 RepID=A0ABS6EMY4_9CLOT|nr:NmrA family NAD(P)-binding protein [Clostridium mobile]MBU5485770.1 NmrA family NAD(P)-binding protein [Clostridium mobile]
MLLVTGITGHSGRYFLQELIKNKYEGTIRCIIRETSDTSMLDNSQLKIEKVVGNLDDKEFIDKAMVGVNTIIHIYNIHHSPVIVQTAIKNNVKKAILVHTTGIYSNFKNASQEYKEIEKKIIEFVKDSNYKINITILRPTMIYGDLCDHNMSKFIKMIHKLPIIPVIDKGNSLIQPVNARDLGKAYYTVLKFSSKNPELKAYDLSGDKPIKMIDVLKLISQELNKKVIFVNIPMGLGVFTARIMKALSIGKFDVIEKVQRMGENRSYSHGDATNDFGYNPMPFEDGIKIEVGQYKVKQMKV